MPVSGVRISWANAASVASIAAARGTRRRRGGGLRFALTRREDLLCFCMAPPDRRLPWGPPPAIGASSAQSYHFPDIRCLCAGLPQRSQCRRLGRFGELAPVGAE